MIVHRTDLQVCLVSVGVHPSRNRCQFDGCGMERISRQCAEVVLRLLQEGAHIGREDVVGRGLLSPTEWTRAIILLRKQGVIARTQKTLGGPAGHARFEWTGKLLDPDKSGTSALPQFDELLKAWATLMQVRPVRK